MNDITNDSQGGASQPILDDFLADAQKFSGEVADLSLALGDATNEGASDARVNAINSLPAVVTSHMNAIIAAVQGVPAS